MTARPEPTFLAEDNSFTSTDAWVNEFFVSLSSTGFYFSIDAMMNGSYEVASVPLNKVQGRAFHAWLGRRLDEMDSEEEQSK